MKKRTLVKSSVVRSSIVTALLISPVIVPQTNFHQKTSAAIAAVLESFQSPGIYFEENFRNYKEHAPTTVDDPGIVVYNDAIFAQAAGVTVNMSKDGFVLRNDTAVPKNLTNYDLLFNFQLQKNEELGHFDIYLRQDDNGEKSDIVVGLSSDNISISSQGINPAIKKSTFDLPFKLQKGVQHDAAIKVDNGTLKIFIDNDRVFEEVASVSIPKTPSAGANFYGYKESPFRLSDIVVRDPAPLSDHTITNIMPAPLKNDTAAFTKGASETIKPNDAFGASIITGKGDGVKVTINWADGNPTVLKFAMKAQSEKLGSKESTIPDSIISQTGLKGAGANTDVYVRPFMRRYRSNKVVTDTYQDIMRDVDLLPKASEYPLKVELRKTAAGVDLYLDGSLADSIKGKEVQNAVFEASPEASVGNGFSTKHSFDTQKYFPLDISSQHMAKSFVDAKSSIKAGFFDIANIPMFVASGSDSADVGLTRAGQGNWSLEADEYTARLPFDGLLTEIHSYAPAGAPYTKAWVLCALDPDPSKDPILTTRVTHYEPFGVGRNTMSDTTIRIDPKDKNIKEVGEVTITKQGKNVKIPLYLVEIPLKSGEIIDLYKNDKLDIDFFGKPDDDYQQIDKSTQPDPRSTSSVQIFGATLEKSSVGMDVEQSQHGNVFANDEKPEMTVVLNSFGAAKGKLVWKISDVDGNNVKTESQEYSFQNAGEEQKVLLSLNMEDLGWYQLDISIEDDKGNVFLEHPASFALLGKDLRKAKYDSPYGTWWWAGTHKTTEELDLMGPLMFKAGLRKVAWTRRFSDEELAPWYMTISQIKNVLNKRMTDPDKVRAEVKEKIDAALQKNPRIDEVMLLHENGPQPFLPEELLGLKPDPKEVESQKKFADWLNLYGKIIREEYPDLKIVVGNHNESAGPITAILRNGGNIDYIDYVGNEAASQVIIPEKMQEYSLQGMQITKDIGKVLSGRDFKFTATSEFTYRSAERLGSERQAQFYTRDGLISLANSFTRIGPASLSDTKNAYFNRYWGRSGLMKRTPYNYPKKSYVSIATLTNELDQVSDPRQIPTGSITTYAVEYHRKDGRFSTSLWAARGMADFNVEFDGDATVRVVDMYGRAQNVKTKESKITVNAGERPAYLTTNRKIKAITLNNRTFPKDMARAELAEIVAPLDNTNAVALDTNLNIDTPLKSPIRLPIRKQGDFSLAQVKDSEKGNALELTLNTSSTPDLSKYYTEYTAIRLKDPVTIKGKPDALGVWVKGNSNWGDIAFEFEDAEGEVWRSLATTGWGVNVLDWPGYIATNFDGWNFVSYPIHETSLFRAYGPGPASDQWVSSGGNKKIDYPIKATAVIVHMNRQPVNLTGFAKATNTIRLKGLSSLTEKPNR